MRPGGAAAGDSDGRRWHSAAAALVVALAAAAYAPLPRNGFVGLDDDPIVVQNPAVNAGLGGTAIVYAFTSRDHYFQPLALLSLATDRSLFGLDPRGIHAVNWALHVATALLVLAGLAAATGRLAASTALAALFAVHPVNVEAVAWAAERRTVLAGLLGIAACLAYGKWARARRRVWYAGALLAFALSLLAKPMLVTLPLLLLAVDVWPLRRVDGADVRRWQALLVEKVPFAIASAASVLVTFASLADQAGPDVEARGMGLRAATGAIAVFRHVGHLVVPADLTVFYPYPDAPPAAWPLAAAALVAATVGCLRVRAHSPWWLAGWCWFLAALLPTLGFRQAGTWAALADRHVYVAALGPIAAACFQVDAWVAARGPQARRAAVAATACCGLALAALAARQVTFWHDPVTLLTRAVRYAPGESVLESTLGTALAERGDDAAAEPHLAAAAQACFQRGAGCSQPWGIYTNLSIVYARTGRLDDAIRAARFALQLAPEYPQALFTLASHLERAGRHAEALPYYAAFVRVSPPSPFRDAALTALRFSQAQLR